MPVSGGSSHLARIRLKSACRISSWLSPAGRQRGAGVPFTSLSLDRACALSPSGSTPKTAPSRGHHDTPILFYGLNLSLCLGILETKIKLYFKNPKPYLFVPLTKKIYSIWGCFFVFFRFPAWAYGGVACCGKERGGTLSFEVR